MKNTFTPDDVVDTVPMIRYFMAKDLTAKDKADYQKFIDFSVKNGTLRKAGRRHRLSQGFLIHMADGALLMRTVERVPTGAPLAGLDCGSPMSRSAA